MFNKAVQAQAQMPQSTDIPETSVFEIKLPNGEWEKTNAHTVEINDGVLVLIRAGYGTEDHSKTRLMPVRVYAPGEWRQAKTDWTGFAKSQFAIR